MSRLVLVCVLFGVFLGCQGYYSYSAYLPNYSVTQQDIFSFGPFNEPFESGLYFMFDVVGDVGYDYYDDTDFEPGEYLAIILDNTDGMVLYYQFLGGDTKITTTISGFYCYWDCVDPTSNPYYFLESYQGRGINGARNYGYLYIDPDVAAQLLSSNYLDVTLRWGAGVDQLVQGAYTFDVDGAFMRFSFNPAVLVGDPHLTTPTGNEESIPTVNLNDQAYALYCDLGGSYINGIVHDTGMNAYILTAVEMEIQACLDPFACSPFSPQYLKISGFVDPITNQPKLLIDDLGYINVATPNYYDTYGGYIRVMNFEVENDPKFIGELARYYKTVIHIFGVYDAFYGVSIHVTIRTGFHPQMKGFFEVIVQPHEYIEQLGKSSRALHVAKGTIPVVNQPVGLLFKDSSEMLSDYIIPDISINTCSGPIVPPS